ncbi:hypothetical protein [Cohnella cholangitidis]|uniref:hypothetical protein n=1 Tax=Cohnella cholangitidis TaxID=2598458 RepID=UPI0015FE7E9B|nr:hypothetical protein [Cohnella cholangitidis]
MLYIIVGIVLLIFVIGAFKSDNAGCGCLILLLILLFILWRTGQLANAWNLVRVAFYYFKDWVSDTVFG